MHEGGFLEDRLDETADALNTCVRLEMNANCICSGNTNGTTPFAHVDRLRPDLPLHVSSIQDCCGVADVGAGLCLQLLPVPRGMVGSSILQLPRPSLAAAAPGKVQILDLNWCVASFTTADASRSFIDDVIRPALDVGAAAFRGG